MTRFSVRCLALGALPAMSIALLANADASPEHKDYRAPWAYYQLTMRLWVQDPEQKPMPTAEQMTDAIAQIAEAGDQQWAEIALVAAADAYPENGFSLTAELNLALCRNDAREIHTLVSRLNQRQIIGSFEDPLQILPNVDIQPRETRPHILSLPELANKYSTNTSLNWLCAQILARYGKPDLALPLYQRVLKRSQIGPVSLHISYADCLEALKKYDEALPQRRWAVELAPTAQNHAQLAQLLTTLKKWDEAEKEFASAVAADDQITWIWSEWAECELGQGHKQKSDQCLARAEEAARHWSTFRE